VNGRGRGGIWELGHERGCLGGKNIHGARLGYDSHRLRDARLYLCHLP
jgi:hypothetical protein